MGCAGNGQVDEVVVASLSEADRHVFTLMRLTWSAGPMPLSIEPGTMRTHMMQARRTGA